MLMFSPGDKRALTEGEYETGKGQPPHVPGAWYRLGQRFRAPYTCSATRIRALRLRGLRETSSAEGLTGFFVRILSSG